MSMQQTANLTPATPLAPGFPKTMMHPAYQPAKLGTSAGEGAPVRYPPITVFTPDQEGQYRAVGYFPGGEPPAPPSAFVEYPMMLVHPRHVPARPATREVHREGDKLIDRTIPGGPEKHGPVIVHTLAQREQWEKQGYVARKADPEAFAKAKAAPYAPQAVDVREYPKWVGSRIVNSIEEECAITGEPLPRKRRVAPGVALEPISADRRDEMIAELQAQLAELQAPRVVVRKPPRQKAAVPDAPLELPTLDDVLALPQNIAPEAEPSPASEQVGEPEPAASIESDTPLDDV